MKKKLKNRMGRNAFVLRRVLASKPKCERCTERGEDNHDKCLNLHLGAVNGYLTQRFTTADLLCGCPCWLSCVATSFAPSFAEDARYRDEWVEFMADRDLVGVAVKYAADRS